MEKQQAILMMLNLLQENDKRNIYVENLIEVLGHKDTWGIGDIAEETVKRDLNILKNVLEKHIFI